MSLRVHLLPVRTVGFRALGLWGVLMVVSNGRGSEFIVFRFYGFWGLVNFSRAARFRNIVERRVCRRNLNSNLVKRHEPDPNT